MARSESRWTEHRTTLLRALVLLAGLILLTGLVLHAPRMAFPMLAWDDFWFLHDSWTWSATWENLWRPINDHAMPLSRVTTRLLIALSGCLGKWVKRARE